MTESIGETSRPLAVRLREHRNNLEQGLLEKSKLAQHAYEEGHKIGWDNAKIAEIESNIKYRILYCSIPLHYSLNYTQ
jgi:hypothetical protein